MNKEEIFNYIKKNPRVNKLLKQLNDIRNKDKEKNEEYIKVYLEGYVNAEAVYEALQLVQEVESLKGIIKNMEGTINNHLMDKISLERKVRILENELKGNLGKSKVEKWKEQNYGN